MKRPLIVAVAVLLTLMALWGCSRDSQPAPGQKAGQKSPAQPQQPAQPKPPDKKDPAASPGDYFPLAKGTVWEYQGEGNEYASFSREVLFVEGSRAQVREDNGGTVMAVIFETTPEAVTKVYSQGEVYDRVNLLGRPDNVKTIILKSPLKVGTKWQDPNGEREIVELSATVDTPSGRYDQCLKVKIAGRDSTLYEYFRLGVGMVKREFVSGEARVTSSLKKYSPAK